MYQDKLTAPGDKPEVTLDNVHPEAFDRVMKFMYTGTCDVAELGPCGLKIRKEELVKKEKDADEVDLEVIGELRIGVAERNYLLKLYEYNSS